jgi:perosamine synthetase
MMSGRIIRKGKKYERNRLLNKELEKQLNNLIKVDGKYKINEIRYAIEALTNHNSSMSWVNELETRFSEKLGVRHAIACNSGTSGLHAALYAADIGPGDEVIIPALTVIMDAYPVLHLGGIPIFADVCENTHLISVDEIRRKITPKTKAIITVAWEGLSCDMDPILKIANDNNITVIDDSARNILGKYRSSYAGTLADINVYSFEAKKHMTAGGEGGMIITNNSVLAQKIRKFSGIGYRHLSADAGRTHLAISEVQDPNYLRFDTIGLNYRMNDISAAIALGQLERIDEIVSNRKIVAQLFIDAMNNCEWLIPQHVPEGYEHSYYTVAADYKGEDQIGVSWKEFYNKYIEMGGDGFYSVVAIPYLEPSLRGKVIGDQSCEPGLCPISERLQKRVMCFKTNYRDLKVAQNKAKILNQLIKAFS